MPLLLEALSPLLKKRDTYYVAAILVLGFLAMNAGRRIKVLDAALAARPKVETRVETKIVTKTVLVQGPERIVEKLVKGDVVERIIYKDVATTTTDTGTEKDYEKSSAPASAPAAPAPWRYAGVLVDPSASAPVVGLRGGVTFWNRLDLGLGWRFLPHPIYQGEVSVRF